MGLSLSETLGFIVRTPMHTLKAIQAMVADIQAVLVLVLEMPRLNLFTIILLSVPLCSSSTQRQ